MNPTSSMIGADLVERTLTLSRSDETVVIVTASSAVNLRWANNTLTTNGATRDQSITVISIVGRSFGVRSASMPNDEQLELLIRASEQDARQAVAAEDYAPLVSGATATDFGTPAVHTTTDVLTRFADELGSALKGARARNTALFGFAEHKIDTIWLGTSSGTRLRHTQPTGSVQWTAKDSATGGSTWHGQGTLDFTDVFVAETDELLHRRLAWSAKSVELPAGRYENASQCAVATPLACRAREGGGEVTFGAQPLCGMFNTSPLG